MKKQIFFYKNMFFSTVLMFVLLIFHRLAFLPHMCYNMFGGLKMETWGNAHNDCQKRQKQSDETSASGAKR
jgi:hypothetical protein